MINYRVGRKRERERERERGVEGEKDGKMWGRFCYKYTDIAVPGRKEWAVSRVSVIFHGRHTSDDDFMQIKDAAR